MKEKIIHNDKLIDVIAAVIFGFLIFALLYGLRTLNVTNEDYIYIQGGDILSHHIGWKFFRESAWSFPFGSVDNIAYPDKISIIYLDCIPWFAFLCKILSPILPQTFQYMGIYGLLCYVLQIYLGIKITRHFVQLRFGCESKLVQYAISVLGGIVIGLSAPMIFRVFYHQELASHYLILAVLYLWISRKEIKEYIEYLAIFVLGFFASITHIYFVPMIGMILICIAITDSIRKSCLVRRNIVVVLAFVVGALLSFFLFGGFSGNYSMSAAGVNYYNANLNTLFNPMGRGIYLSSLNNATGGQYEGYGYLGLGWIILSAVALVLIILKRKFIEKRYIIAFSIGFVLFVLIAFMAAVGNIISFNESTIATIKYPSLIELLLNIFRSNGRFIWVVLYIFPVFSIGISIRFIDKSKYVVGLLIFAVIVQLTDFVPVWMQGGRWNSVYVSEMQSNGVWDEIAEHINHIVYLPDGLDYAQHEKLFDLADFALKNEISLDNFYYGRPRGEYVSSRQNEFREILYEGNVPNDTMLIFDDVFEPSYVNYNLHYYNVDNYIIGIPFVLNDVEEIDYSEGIELDLMQAKNAHELLKKDAGVALTDENSLFSGPVWNLYQGHYVLDVNADATTNIELKIVSSVGMGEVENIEKSSVSESHLQYDFDVPEVMFGARFLLYNSSDEEIIVDKVCLNKSK